MTPVYVLVYVCAMVIIAVTALKVTTRIRHRLSGRIVLHRKPRLSTTSILDRKNGPKRCRVCLGELDDGPIAICSCGAVIHVACARATDHCPFCGRPTETMRQADLRLPACPVCGTGLQGGRCPACGAIVTGAERFFECPLCHRPVSVRRPVCDCGARFEPIRPKSFMGRLR